MDPTAEPGLHPRLAQAHIDLHSSPPYQAAIRLTDSGQVAAALPPAHRTTIKGNIEHALMHFHDLGFAAGLNGVRDPEPAIAELEHTEIGQLRVRMEGVIHRLGEDIKLRYRETENRWKRIPANEPHKKRELHEQLAAARRDMSKLNSLDKHTLVAKVALLCGEAYRFGWEKGVALMHANERRQRLGLPVEHIEIEVIGDWRPPVQDA